MKHHSGCCASAHKQEGPAKRKAGEPPIGLAGPVSQAIVEYAARTRHQVHGDLVERHARELHARASYDCWNGLSDRDQELWRHMARLDLTEGQRA
ncbi:hypothetical protein [Modestobacter sp. SSW1-42]|uniref:hypothetical protein n=1 Tax=Modestobacter sp. SSW1-42 TaxID=596372 RepID=UPI003987F9AB